MVIKVEAALRTLAVLSEPREDADFMVEVATW